MKLVVRSFVALALAGTLAVPLAAAHAAPGNGKGRSPSAAVGSGNASFGHIGTVVDSQTETDLHTGVVTAFTRIEEYDSRGRLFHSLEEDSVDGVVVSRFESTAEFGADGTETIVTVADGDGDGPGAGDLIVSVFAYGKRGLLRSIDTTYDFGSDGSIDSTDHESFTRDQRGRTLTIHAELGPNPFDAGTVIDTTFTYDKHGNPTSVVDVYDYLDTARSPDEKIVNTGSYDARGNFLSGVTEVYEYDDQGNAELSSRETFESVYGKSGRRIAEHATADVDGDGTIDVVSDTVLGYDRRGNQTSSVQTSVMDGETTVSTMKESFDRRGNSVSFLFTEEVDGQLAFRRVEASTFDKAGRFTGFTESTDFDGDGVVDVALRQVVTGWDSRGRVTTFHTTDEDGAGNVLAVHDVSIEWFKDHQVRTSFHDDDNDGTYDRKLVLVVPLVF